MSYSRLFPPPIRTCLLLGCLAAFCPADEPPQVTTAKPRRQDATQSLSLPAGLDPYERVQLYAKVSGYIREMKVDVGDRVKTGQVLARLWVPELDDQLKLAQAKVKLSDSKIDKAKAGVKVKAATHGRLAKLREASAGAVAELDVEVAAAELQAADAEVAMAQAELQVAKAEADRLKTLVDYATIASPFDGVVTRRGLDTGALVPEGTSTGKPIVELMRNDKLRLAFDIPERLVPYLDRQTTVRYSIESLGGAPVESAVTRTAGAVRPDTRSMRAEIDIPNADGRLAPGMYATVQVPLNRLRNVWIVPAQALRSRNAHPMLFTVTAGAAHSVAVTILMDDGKEVAVAGDLPADAAVITTAPPDLKDGQAVRVKTD